MSPADGPFRGGTVHVLADRCSSCIFRHVTDGRIHLNPGRVAGMVADARAADSAITCHATLYRDDVAPAVCRGFADLPRQTLPLRLAAVMGLIVYDEPPTDARVPPAG